MPPNPVVIPRHRPSSQSRQCHQQTTTSWSTLSLLSIAALVIAGVTSKIWGHSWVTSGTGPASIILYLLPFQAPSLQDGYSWLSLAVLNIAFAIACTSWFLYPFFVVIAYTITFWICMLAFPVVSSSCRRVLRTLCPGVYFSQDKIAFSNVPALEIDTEVNGMFVIRGLTFSLLDLALEARGIELGVRLNNDVELALCADRLTVRLFRHIQLSDIYGNLKVEEAEMYFEPPGNSRGASIETSQQENGGIITLLNRPQTGRARNEASKGYKGFADHDNADAASDEPEHNSTRSANDAESESRYGDFLTQIEHSSQIYIARSQIEGTESSKQPSNEREMRQAVCAKLQDVPSVSHTPKYAVKVSVLQRIFPRLRRFLHRLPLLFRLLLNPLSNFHPIDIASVSVAGPGEKLKEFLENYVSKIMAQEAQDADMEQFQQEMSEWLAGATFCMEAADIKALSHVPLSSAGEITTYMRSGNVSMYRTPLESNEVTQVTHIGGTDATCVLPVMLLPHHEHCLPPPSSDIEADLQDSSAVDETKRRGDDMADHTEVTVSVHASLPTHFDQSLLDFAAVLLKATKLIDLENLFERDSSSTNQPSEQYKSAVESSHINSSAEDAITNSNTSEDPSSRVSETRDEQPNLSKRLTKRAYHSIKDGVKKGTMINVASNKINDRWVMRTVSRIAARLEHAQGDFGYTTNIPLSLKPYREAGESPSKILP